MSPGCQAILQAARKAGFPDGKALAWNYNANMSPPKDLEQMPGYLYRAGLASDVTPGVGQKLLYPRGGHSGGRIQVPEKSKRRVPQELRNFEPRDQVLYPPAETESDTVVLNDMWFDGLEDDPELKQDRQEGEAKLSFEDGYQGAAVVGLTYRIDIDRIFLLFLGIPEFLKPRIPPCGYKSKPWMHMNHERV